mmetsp:Transcript_62472/g.148781  ORF Transcript_62472/g.148781 Transcript_62472/m.148781 type:complete len:216 (+) Transcript_62472:459-1106(+)
MGPLAPSSRSALPDSGGDGKLSPPIPPNPPIPSEFDRMTPRERGWLEGGFDTGSVLIVIAALCSADIPQAIALDGWLLLPRSAFFWDPLVRGCRSDISRVGPSELRKELHIPPFVSGMASVPDIHDSSRPRVGKLPDIGGDDPVTSEMCRPLLDFPSCRILVRSNMCPELADSLWACISAKRQILSARCAVSASPKVRVAVTPSGVTKSDVPESG